MKVKVVGFVEKYSLYINGEAVTPPQKPVWDWEPDWNGDLIEFSEGMEIRIGETVPGKQLRWLVVKNEDGEDGSYSWFCDRNLVREISWDKCMDLIGMSVDDGVETDLISFKDCSWTYLFKESDFKESEWYQAVSQIEDAHIQMHTMGCRSWGKDESFIEDMRHEKLRTASIMGMPNERVPDHPHYIARDSRRRSAYEENMRLAPYSPYALDYLMTDPFRDFGWRPALRMKAITAISDETLTEISVARKLLLIAKALLSLTEKMDILLL